jgi:RNA polymerase sigma factor (TIGR02999 family)
MDARTEVTDLLQEWRGGDRDALDRLMPLVYAELRRLAHERLRFERPGHTLGTTALVHEGYLRLAEIRRAGFESRSHFLAMASRAMRRVLVNHARQRDALKRGAGRRDVPLDAAPQVAAEEDRRLLDLDAALTRFESMDPRQAEVLERYYFTGLRLHEVAEVMGMSPATVKRDLRSARAWLATELGDA